MKRSESIYKLGVALSVAFAALVLGGEPSPKPIKGETTTGFERVKVQIEDRWVSLKELGELSRDALKQKDQSPPSHIKPLFDLLPGEKVFLRVRFSQGIGKRSWYVEFDRDGKVLEVGSGITEG
jgi:hypothetical protein